MSTGGPYTPELTRERPAASVAVETTLLEQAMESGDPEKVRLALADGAAGPEQRERIIELLAWDAVAPDAVRILSAMSPEVVPVLLQHLLDPDEDFAIRRRLVAVVAGYRTPESFEGLFQALGDRRFEVRYRAGLALSRMAEEIPDVKIDRDRVLGVVSREMSVERTVWESRQLIDTVPEAASPMQTDLLHDRVSRSLEHLFSLFSLILPRSSLRLTFQALHTDDSYLRGTALEYLATVLPEPIWRKLWTLLESGDLPTREPRASGEALRALLRSQETISVALSEIRKAAERSSS
jgi:HEAT repeat protein